MTFRTQPDHIFDPDDPDWYGDRVPSTTGSFTCFVMAVVLVVWFLWAGLAHATEGNLQKMQITQEPTISCWQAKLFLAAHGGDRVAARNAARARGATERQITETMRRCDR